MPLHYVDHDTPRHAFLNSLNSEISKLITITAPSLKGKTHFIAWCVEQSRNGNRYKTIHMDLLNFDNESEIVFMLNLCEQINEDSYKRFEEKFKQTTQETRVSLEMNDVSMDDSSVMVKVSMPEVSQATKEMLAHTIADELAIASNRGPTVLLIDHFEALNLKPFFQQWLIRFIGRILRRTRVLCVVTRSDQLSFSSNRFGQTAENFDLPHYLNSNHWNDYGKLKGFHQNSNLWNIWNSYYSEYRGDPFKMATVADDLLKYQ